MALTGLSIAAEYATCRRTMDDANQPARGWLRAQGRLGRAGALPVVALGLAGISLAVGQAVCVAAVLQAALAGSGMPAAMLIAFAVLAVLRAVAGVLSERAAFDQKIIDWADTVDDAWLAADLTYYSGATKREWTRPRWMLVTHMFNHQTHHRGQVHSMLTQAGGKPSDTDLPFMPD